MIGYPPGWKLLRLACGGVTCGIDLSRRPAFHPGNAVLIGGGLPFIVPQTWYSLAAAWQCMITPCKCARVTDVSPPTPPASLALVSLQAPNFHSPIPGRRGEGTARFTLRSHPRHLVPPHQFSKAGSSSLSGISCGASDRLLEHNSSIRRLSAEGS